MNRPALRPRWAILRAIEEAHGVDRGRSAREGNTIWIKEMLRQNTGAFVDSNLLEAHVQLVHGRERFGMWIGHGGALEIHFVIRLVDVSLVGKPTSYCSSPIRVSDLCVIFMGDGLKALRLRG